jgi:hypothetical protein
VVTFVNCKKPGYVSKSSVVVISAAGPGLNSRYLKEIGGFAIARSVRSDYF